MKSLLNRQTNLSFTEDLRKYLALGEAIDTLSFEQEDFRLWENQNILDMAAGQYTDEEEQCKYLETVKEQMKTQNPGGRKFKEILGYMADVLDDHIQDLHKRIKEKKESEASKITTQLMKMNWNECNYEEVQRIQKYIRYAIVLGQQYLRDESKRREWVDKGYEVILLLNNGCSFECMHKKCNSRVCSALYENSRKQYDEEEIYAIQSFFPTELKVLLERDRASDNYIFKISNRPLGLEYTKKVLDAYSTLAQYTETDFDNNPKKYALFGALTELCRRIDKYHYSRIMEIKRSLMKDM